MQSYNISFNNGIAVTANLLQKFSDRILYVTITEADLGSLKSLRKLFDIYVHNICSFINFFCDIFFSMILTLTSHENMDEVD